MNRNRYRRTLLIGALLVSALQVACLNSMSPDPSPPPTVVWTPLSHFEPVPLSGLSMAFDHNVGGSHELWLITDAMGQQVRHQIATSDTTHLSITLSPDARFLAYTQIPDTHDHRLHVIDLQSGTVAELFRAQQMLRIIGWNPTGTQVLLILEDFPVSFSELVLCDVRTGITRSLLRGSNEAFLSAQYSSQEEKIAFFGTKIAPKPELDIYGGRPPILWEFELYTLDLVTGKRQSIAPKTRSFPRDLSAMPTIPIPALAWSPRGDQIIFHAGYDADQEGSIYIVDADGSNLKRLVDVGDLEIALRWHPQAPVFACSKRGPDTFFTFNIDTGEKTDLAEKLGEYRSFYVEAWSPEGEQIAFWSHSDVEQRPGVFGLDIQTLQVKEILMIEISQYTVYTVGNMIWQH